MLCDGDINLQSLLLSFDEVLCYKNEDKGKRQEREISRQNQLLSIITKHCKKLVVKQKR